jgi:PAS domain S-box-containing protein
MVTHGGMASPEAFLSAVLDGVPQPVCVVDRRAVIIFANPAAVTALGYDDAAQLRGRSSHQTVHYKRPDGSPYPIRECPMGQPLTSGETVHSEDEWLVRRDGSMFPVAWWSAPIELPSGRGAVLAFTDITDRLEAQRGLRERDAAQIRAAASRAAQRRIIETSSAVRRQVSRDLHDGAQQRLVNLIIGLQLAREGIGRDPAVRAVLDDAADQAKAALDELRELAAGVHPRILTSRGLRAALDALAERSSIAVAIDGTLEGRLPEAIESSAYFIVAEALTNVVKHARATEVRVTVDVDPAATELVVEVRDDGVGGARLHDVGTGLAGLADRVDALDGALDVRSPPGGGTRLRARLPLEPGDAVPPA